MKDTATEAGWEEVREYMPPYGVPQYLPEDAVPENVAQLVLYRVVPAGVPLVVIEAGIAYLMMARDIVALTGWHAFDVEGAVDDGDFSVHPLDPKAQRWSIGGAIVKAIGNCDPVTAGTSADAAFQAVMYSIRKRHNCTPNFFNDYKAKSAADVADEFTAAIALLDERAKALR